MFRAGNRAGFSLVHLGLTPGTHIELCRHFEVIVRPDEDEVVIHRDSESVPAPCGDHMHRQHISQFRFPRRP